MFHLTNKTTLPQPSLPPSRRKSALLAGVISLCSVACLMLILWGIKVYYVDMAWQELQVGFVSLPQEETEAEFIEVTPAEEPPQSPTAQQVFVLVETSTPLFAVQTDCLEEVERIAVDEGDTSLETAPAPKPVVRVQAKPQRTPPPATAQARTNPPPTESTPQGITAKPRYKRNPHPPYPQAARVAQQQGVVHLLIRIDSQGNPERVSLSKSSGFKVLDDAAQTWVKSHWLFYPALSGSTPVPSTTIAPLRFTLQ